MKREIKFRAWDNEQMYSKCTAGTDVNSSVHHDGQWLACTEKVIVMQYTGLKDKNGKEIYEGDVIRSSSNGIGSVEWDDRNATYRSIGKSADMTFSVIARESEIIGNIYESPELQEVVSERKVA